ncbi:hypothetical protein CWE04_04970 [Thomasclavelia cocleata]|uniref:Uncharacterized protein n=1 Tax=Thomasclavelia cocleata TaxID=69824 RepID=A0A1I0CM64_9FIRM|nr:hypothetical protein CWE04_04970 [Thomasclavelia cocleata]SET20728.1 hypothetical protein SAMN04489758_103124 [Thomasclavelia cocleata]
MIYLNKSHCYMLVVGNEKCYSYNYAQKRYNAFLHSDDKILKVSLYRFKNDLKPKYEFNIAKDKTLNKNLFLQILYLIELDITRYKRILAEKAKKEKQEQEYLEMLKKAEKEAEEWYLDFIMENVKHEDLWLYCLLADPKDFEQFQYYSPADIVYMSYTLAVLDRGTDIDHDGLLEKNINDISDIDIEDLVYRFETSCREHWIKPNFHDEMVKQYSSRFDDNVYIKNRIMRNNNAYRNLHKTKPKMRIRQR